MLSETIQPIACLFAFSSLLFQGGGGGGHQNRDMQGM